ncbi:hypothetical protein BD560DRAFT_442611 [Blakeslea trispora]|nr:hypothetical protein BD560DRAFT_442611 [Blakeslea trispora]
MVTKLKLFFGRQFVVPVSSNERISNQEEVPQIIRSWNKSKKKAFKPNVQVKRNIKRRRTAVGEDLPTTTPKRTSTAAKFSGGRRYLYSNSASAAQKMNEMLAMSTTRGLSYTLSF